jgi:hypothetical protein
MEKKETYLYVLLLPHMDKEYNFSYKVKFGYTENFDNRMKNGYSSYYGEDGYQILHVYKGDFTKEKDEYTIKQYLREYSLYGSEWFKCCKEVLEFFNTYDTSEKLKKKILEMPVPSKNSYNVDFRLVKCVYEELFRGLDLFTRIHRREELEETLKSYSLINQLKYIKTTYGFSDSIISKYVNIFVLELADEFLKAKSTKGRLKYFVYLKDKNLTPDDLQEFFRLVPPNYEEYYEFLGFDGIKRLNFNKEKITKKIKPYNKKFRSNKF